MERKKISFSKSIFFGNTDSATFLSVWYMPLKYGNLFWMRKNYGSKWTFKFRCFFNFEKISTLWKMYCTCVSYFYFR